MDFTPGLHLVKRWWPLILAVTLLAGALAYASSFLMTPTYSSATRVLVRARDARFLSSTGEDVASRPGVIDVVQAKSLNQTLAGMATSRAVAEQVVTELGLDQPPTSDTTLWAQIRSTVKTWYRAAVAYFKYGYYAEPERFEGAVNQLRRNITALPIKDSYLIEIKVQAEGPELAVASADAVTRAFVRRSAEEFERNASNYQAVLASEVERARGEVVATESALRQYKEQHAIADVAESVRLGAADEDSLRQQLREVESDLRSARARHASLERTLATLSPTERSTTTTTGQNATTTSSVADAGRGATSTVNDTTIDTTENRGTISPNRVYQDVQREALTLDAQISGLEAKHTELTAAAAQRTQMNIDLAAHSAQINALELQRNTAHATFSAIRSSYESAIVNDARGAEEVTQVDAATRPLYPDRPLRYLFALLGLICGLASGVGLAFLFDRWSPAWRPIARHYPAPAAAGASAATWSEQPGSAAMTTVSAAAPQPLSGRYET